MESILIVGCGEIGRRVGVLCRHKFPNALIVAQTRTPQKHVELQIKGFQTETWDPTRPTQKQFSHVLIAVPPTQAASAPGLMSQAIARWNTRGNLITVSSISVYSESNGGWIDEDSSVSGDLITQEEKALDARGSVVRLAGLYSETRGPQHVYRRKKEIPSNPKSWINLIHDDDAAQFCFLALTKGEPQSLYLGADHAPMMRQELARIAALMPPPTTPCEFTDLEGTLGKRCQPKKSWAALGFTPRWSSFQDFAQAMS